MSLSHDLLKKHWGHDSFRGLQQEAIDSILGGKDTLLIMPTGSGKSLCFQLPALMAKGVCLVVSPLIALMKDQVQQLNKKNIPAAALYSGLSADESREVYRNALDEDIKLLYVSPERLQSERFLRFLTNATISFIAVDEAHCIAQWGHDFRPAYLNIKDIKYKLPNKPILALTATATPKVEEEIVERLELKTPQIFSGSFVRKELSLKVKKVENKETELVAILKKNKRSAIVYCRSRRACKELSLLLNQEKINSTFYHAGLSKEERDQAQNDWLENRAKVIVSTNAFGMGIDKADVGLVVHYDLPESLEAYYQEVGRAGRNGQNAEGIILYNSKSISRQNDLAALKFPSENELRNLYAAVCNYLKIPTGGGAEEYFDFDLLSFVKATNYNLITALHGMQLLAKQKIWHLSDSVYMPMRVQILASREELNHIAQHYHRQDELLKQLLRMYNGIWQYPVPINEYDLAPKVKKSVAQIKEDLHFLASRSYIKLVAKKDKPQLYFSDNRYPAEQIILNYQEIEWHKKRDEERLAAMQKYVLNKSNCRMQVLANYFGQAEKEVCGVCDIDNPVVVKVDFEEVKKLLDNALTNKESVPFENIIGHLHGEERIKTMQLIRQMIGEGMYRITALGEVRKS
jgi:ATP-dependent DNA helicase RecQ